MIGKGLWKRTHKLNMTGAELDAALAGGGGGKYVHNIALLVSIDTYISGNVFFTLITSDSNSYTSINEVLQALYREYGADTTFPRRAIPATGCWINTNTQNELYAAYAVQAYSDLYLNIYYGVYKGSDNSASISMKQVAHTSPLFKYDVVISL